MLANRILPLCLAFSLFIVGKGFAQNAPNSLSPGKSTMLPATPTATKHKAHKQRTRVFAPKKRNVKNSPEYEFYERIEQVAKEKQRALKILSKRQYSDPRYFGHKRIPKRHPANKMKYCGECGIRH